MSGSVVRRGVSDEGAERLLQPAARVVGELRVPGDKPISHRSLILGAVGRGTTVVRGISTGGDVQATAAILRQLGVSISPLGAAQVVVSPPPEGRLVEPRDVLDCGNSGTSMRLLAGLLAGQPFQSVLTGDASLRRRPMGRIVEPLGRMGADVRGRADGGAPLVVRGGPLGAVEHRSPVASAQVKSCLLLAGLGASGRLVLREPHPSRDHSELMLRARGVEIEMLEDGVAMLGGQRVGALPGGVMTVPGDISAAAFFLVAGALLSGSSVTVHGVGTNATRDGVLDVLAAAGVPAERAAISWQGGEAVADLRVRSAPLRAFEIGGALVPRLIDEIPVLAVLAARAEGTSIVRDAADLRAKESDRVASTAALLRAFGVEVRERSDGLEIDGQPQRPLRGGGVVEAAGDHRIAMAAAVAALVADGPVTLRGAEAVSTSFPSFFDTLERCAHA